MTVPGTGALSPGEIDGLLQGTAVARLATIDPDGYPSIVPVWIEWDGATVWIVGRAAADYVANLRRNPRVGVSVVDPADADRRVEIRGRASVADGPGPLGGRMLDLARAMAERHEGVAGLAYIEESRAWPRVLVAVNPTSIRSWGSPDWHPRYRRPPPGRRRSPTP